MKTIPPIPKRPKLPTAPEVPEWILKFCNPISAGLRFDFSKPCAHGGFIYATDAIICVRVPWPGPEIPRPANTPDPAELFDRRKYEAMGKYTNLRPYPTSAETEEDGWESCPDPCHESEDAGESNASECPVCGKRGMIPVKNRMVDDVRVGARLDALIRTLPNVRYQSERHYGRAPLRFVFDGGGEGLVMGKTAP